MRQLENERTEVINREDLKKLVRENEKELCVRCGKDILDRVARVSKEIHLGKELVEVKFGNNIYKLMSDKLPEFIENIVIKVDESNPDFNVYIPVIREK